MKKTLLTALALTLFAAALSILAVIAVPPANTPPAAYPAASAAASSPPSETLRPVPAGIADDKFVVRLKNGDTVTEISMRDYLISAVAGEMPANFEPEALSAQACAIRTYVLYHMQPGYGRHDDADVCTSSSCCLAFKDEAALREKWGDSYVTNMNKIADAADASDGVYITYASAPILAAFHASSFGSTEDCFSVWGGDYLYLRSVSTPETEADVPNLVSSVTVSVSDFIETVTKAYPEAKFPDDVSKWNADMSFDPAGRLEALRVGGVSIPGAELRRIFSLRSTAVSVIFGDEIVMTTSGSGHGVGMSQYGANLMAKQGLAWRDILRAYYTGVGFSDDDVSF
ncbi:MAG: stage II sporulation protein D [Oscillospiraceae bacterium]|jgi:stage II sporulation protein D|nr:stage II sporulation protein D [Oscillospiraceae bacterium]